MQSFAELEWFTGSPNGVMTPRTSGSCCSRSAHRCQRRRPGWSRCSKPFDGLAILLGFAVTILSVPPIASMLVALLTVQIHYEFSTLNTIGLKPSGPVFGPPGYEINLLYIAGLLVVASTGPGAASVAIGLRHAKAADFEVAGFKSAFQFSSRWAWVLVNVAMARFPLAFGFLLLLARRSG
jgi:hypothetical protein